jgi:phenylalanyl-tRNA synthetase beta chain
MKISLQWLKRHIKFKKLDVNDICESLVKQGIEVEYVKYKNPIYVVEIEDVKQVGTKLKLCKVNDTSVICGASNVKRGLKTLFAPVGTQIKDIILQEKTFRIKQDGKVEEYVSNGMLLSHEEAGLSCESCFCIYNENDLEVKNDGIVELPDDAEVGRIVKYDDVVFTLSIPSNRPDLMCVRGIARELVGSGFGVLQDLIFKNSNHEFTPKIKNNSNVLFSFIEIKEPILDDIMFSLLDSVDKKSTDPMQCLNDFILLDVGIPVHIYKYRQQLEIGYVEKGERFTTFGGNDYVSKGNEIIIKSEGVPLCIGGIIGLKDDVGTDHFIIECANFYPNNIPTIISESSKIFWNGGPDYMFSTLSYVISLIQAGYVSKIAVPNVEGNEIVDDSFNYYGPNKIFLSHALVIDLSGVSLSMESIIGILEHFGFKCHVVRKKVEDSVNSQFGIEVTIPSWRKDIRQPEELVAEVLRIYGFHNLLKNDFKISSIDRDIKRLSVDEKVRDYLIDKGCVEIISFPFEKSGEVRIMNPLGEKNHLRNNLYESLRSIGEKALKEGIWGGKIFEIGKIYKEKGEEEKVGILLFGKSNRSWREKSYIYDFFHLKQMVDQLCDISEGYEITNEKIINGLYGEGFIICKTIDNFFYAEISLKNIKFKKYKHDRDIVSFKDYTFSTERKWGEIERFFANYNLRLFDVYEKDNKKKFSFTVAYKNKEEIDRFEGLFNSYV